MARLPLILIYLLKIVIVISIVMLVYQRVYAVIIWGSHIISPTSVSLYPAVLRSPCSCYSSLSPTLLAARSPCHVMQRYEAPRWEEAVNRSSRRRDCSDSMDWFEEEDAGNILFLAQTIRYYKGLERFLEMFPSLRVIEEVG